MTSTENLTAAAANRAATVLTSRKYAAHLADNEPAFLSLSETLTEQLDETGSFADVTYADLHDAAYQALCDRVEELTA